AAAEASAFRKAARSLHRCCAMAGVQTRSGEFCSDDARDAARMSQSVESEIGKIPTFSFISQTGALVYMLMYANYPLAIDTPDAVKTSLNNSRDLMLSRRNGKLISEKDISFGKFAGRELMVKTDDGMLRGRTYIVYHRLYFLMAMALNSDNPSRLESKDV